jgi:hypothetical protein
MRILEPLRLVLAALSIFSAARAPREAILPSAELMTR